MHLCAWIQRGESLSSLCFVDFVRSQQNPSLPFELSASCELSLILRLSLKGIYFVWICVFTSLNLMRTVTLFGLSSVVFCFVFLRAAWRIVDTRLFHSNGLGRWHGARLGAPCHFSFVTSSDASVITRYQLMPWWLIRSALRSRGFRRECKLFLCVSLSSQLFWLCVHA